MTYLIEFSGLSPSEFERGTELAGRRVWRDFEVVRPGTYQSSQGEVKVTLDRLTEVVSNFNEQDRPPLQADHSKRADDNHGHIARVWLDGDVLKATAEFVGAHACERVEDGRWNKFSGGFQQTAKGWKLGHVGITPFPACPTAKLLSREGTDTEMKLGDFLRITREKRNLGADGLAEAAGIELSTYLTIETGVLKRPSDHNLKKLAQALDLTVEELSSKVVEEEPRAGMVAQLSNWLTKLVGGTDERIAEVNAQLEAKQAELAAKEAELVGAAAAVEAKGVELAAKQEEIRLQGYRDQVAELVRDGYSTPAQSDAEVSFVAGLPEDQRAKYFELRRQQPKAWEPGRKTPVDVTKPGDAKQEETLDNMREHAGIKKK